jgi:beta-lactam-binding protein with PASTA domain
MSEEECRFYLRVKACPRTTVPDVVGSTEEAARSTLDAAGFLVVLAFTMPTSDPDKDGTVVVQDPVRGGSLVVGSKVALVIARSTP